MAITAAQVEANGWVLRVTLTGSLGGFASYNLDPSGVPRMTLTSSHAGFVKSGGTAVAGGMVRNTVATWPVRLPVNPASPTVKVIDETDLGGGSIRVRLALSETIYATDTGLSLAVLAGWRTGESAASGIAVTNGSTAVAPIPIMRWVLAPYDVAAGSFTLSLLVASHHPVGFDPVAGVKFTATDGTNTKTVWATALSTDNSHGDNLRCHSVTIDPATATALNVGLLRCDAEVYPWLGSMRSTDTAGTRSMTGLASAGLSSNAAAPFVIGYDPAGTRYSNMFAFVDPVNGTVTASAAMVAASHAAAKAIAAASRPKDVTTALQAGYLFSRALAAGNGGSAAVRSVDGYKIRLAAGTHAGIGATSVSTGITTSEIPVLVEGDPDDADPRSNCIIQTATSSNGRIIRMRLRKLRLECGTTPLIGSLTKLFWVDDIEIHGKAGLETNTTQALSAATSTAGEWGLCATRTKVGHTGYRFGAANLKVGLVRACENSRMVDGLCMVKNRFIPASEDTSITGDQNGYSCWTATADAASVEDIIIAFNDARGLSGSFMRTTPATAANAGTLRDSHRRHVILNNLVERIGASQSSLASYGEDAHVTASYIIVEGNTVVGDRWNMYYSDPVPTTIAETNSQYNEAFCIRQANNAFDWQPSKQDNFSDPTTVAVRGTADGYRPQMIHAWGPHHGAGFEANYDSQRAVGASNGFTRDFDGLRCERAATPTLPGYAWDRSVLGTGAGLGDYTPFAGSPLLGRVVRGNSDRDFAGNARLANGAAGAFEPNIIDLVPAGARQAQLSGSGLTGIALPVVPDASRLLESVAASLLGFESIVAAALSTIAMAADEAAVELLAVEILLQPYDPRLALASPTSRAFPDGAAATLQTLLVHAEPRISFVN